MRHVPVLFPAVNVSVFAVTPPFICLPIREVMKKPMREKKGEFLCREREIPVEDKDHGGERFVIIGTTGESSSVALYELEK